ncbi:MAG: efflux RND transporter periplasmic adaptor subunit [Sandaracinaceae bacterium]|nr:efflux RND transporter periplasmic adaptor subunit [Sandaracinaceae bacterium]
MREGLLALALVTACGAPPEGSHEEAPASVESPIPESDLPVVHLTERAVERLALETGTVSRVAVPAVRRVGGEVIIPPGRVLTVSAPVAGVVRAAADITPGAAVHEGQELLRLVPLAPVDRDTRARASREVEVARATLAAAEARLTRTEALAAERAGSRRAIEEATAARDTARADVDVAQARARAMRSAPLLSDVSMTVGSPVDGIVRAVSVGTGQAVAASAPLLEIVAVANLWVRVPVGSGDVHRVDGERDADVVSLDATSEVAPSRGRVVAGPPTAAPLAGTVDRYYALDASSAAFQPGERVLVSLPLRSEEDARGVPLGAVVYDTAGSAWVYTCEGERSFRRARVDVARRHGELAIFERGPPVDTCVVSVGAAEVFGAEFEPGH